MALQPAAGARDRNPGEVASNSRLCDRLAQVYRLWGYQEVDPPTVERLDTLEAGGAIAEHDLMRLAADEPLGLRPELTASIARAASTRLAKRPRPLRLWASGSTFRSIRADGGGQRLNETLQSGVELLGDGSDAADRELLHLLLAATAKLGLCQDHHTTLLVGHHGLLDALLEQVPAEQRLLTRRALTDFDPVALAGLQLPDSRRRGLATLLGLRGDAPQVLYQLEQWLGPHPLLERLASTLSAVAPAAAREGVRLQLDPTFQPHFDLYDGLVFKLVCRAENAPVEVASGGRYDALVGRFESDPEQAAGMGFAIQIEAVRELLQGSAAANDETTPWLVTSSSGDLSAVLARMAELHANGEAAELHGPPCASAEAAEALAQQRGCRGAIWLAG